MLFQSLMTVHDFIFAGILHLVLALCYLPYYLYTYCSFNAPTIIYYVVSVLLLYFLYLSIGMSICLHRYFSHEAFKVNRFGTFVLSIIGSLANQKGVLWWGSKHIKHHKHCDEPKDPHSVTQTGLMYAWILWIFYDDQVDWNYLPKKFQKPEIIFMNYFHSIPKIMMCYMLYKAFPQYPFEAMYFYYIIPSSLSALSSLTFNVIFHPKEEAGHISKKLCKAVDIPTYYLGYYIGEAFHDDHHDHPLSAHRPGFDLPYYLILKPLESLGIIYDLQ